VLHSVSSLRVNGAAVLSNKDCCEGSCVHQELAGSGLRRGHLCHVACWIRSSSSGDVLCVIGRFLSGLTRCERSGKTPRIIVVILITAPPAIAGLYTGYSRSTRISYVLAMKPPMLSFSLVTKLPLARGYLYIWLPLLLPRIDMN
jgi:hypothetical protein